MSEWFFIYAQPAADEGAKRLQQAKYDAVSKMKANREVWGLSEPFVNLFSDIVF
ncbi:MAG: hypothetical protein K6C40_09515 [Thermoguttaceae bacterium]|nr:hypothetical protein [Thermoguttaceae bacterium]